MNMNVNSSTTNKWLKAATEKLKEAGVATARLDCLVLLEDVLNKDRSYILAHGEEEIDTTTRKKLDEQIKRRIKHEPLSYIRQKSEFYGREFMVTPDTLEPRPETETMIMLLRNLVQSTESRVQSVIDIGTGSGCIAITVKLENPNLEVFATEINKNALLVAKKNARNLGADIAFYQGDVLSPLPDAVLSTSYSVLANLPYVPDSHTINQAAMFEPKVAIFGGSDGLDLYRQLFDQIKELNHKPTYVLTESLPFQHQDLEAVAKSAHYVLQKTEDFVQLFAI